MSNILLGIICSPNWKRGLIIFNDDNVMTTDDIFTSCQLGRTPTIPGLPCMVDTGRPEFQTSWGDKIIWWVYSAPLIGIGLMVEE